MKDGDEDEGNVIVELRDTPHQVSNANKQCNR